MLGISGEAVTSQKDLEVGVTGFPGRGQCGYKGAQLKGEHSPAAMCPKQFVTRNPS